MQPEQESETMPQHICEECGNEWHGTYNDDECHQCIESGDSNWTPCNCGRFERHINCEECDTCYMEAMRESDSNAR